MKPDNLASEIFKIIPQGMHFLRTRLNSMTDGHLSIPQFRIMMRLKLEPESQTGLCAFLGVKPPTLSRMLRCLLKKGYVERTVSKRDARRAELSLSAKGRKHIKIYEAEVLRELNSRVQNLSSSDSLRLEKSLAVLHDLLRSSDDQGDPS